MTAAAPLARYGAMWRARVASGSATAELHHHLGHDPSVCDGVGQRELVAPAEIDVTPGNGREARDIGGERWRSGFAEVAQGFLHVDGVPVHDGVEGQSEGAEMLFLALTQGLLISPRSP